MGHVETVLAPLENDFDLHGQRIAPGTVQSIPPTPCGGCREISRRTASVSFPTSVYLVPETKRFRLLGASITR